MPIRLQEFIHKFEEGAGSRSLKFLLGVFLMVAAAVAYDLAAFRNITTREGMDLAQLAWNIAEGRGFSTYCIRPFSIHLLQKHGLEAQEGPALTVSTNRTATPVAGAEAARLNGSHPDLANPPVYPLLLAGYFKVIQLTHPDLALQQAFKFYAPDLWIG